MMLYDLYNIKLINYYKRYQNIPPKPTGRASNFGFVTKGNLAFLQSQNSVFKFNF